MLPSEPALQIALLGCPRVVHTRTGDSHDLGRPSRLLIACLLLQGRRPHRREALACKLWPSASPESAAKSFRTALWRLRRLLEPKHISSGPYLVISGNGNVEFNWNSDFDADVLSFERGIAAFEEPPADASPEQRIENLKTALRLYNGELLEGSTDDWVIYERERFRRLYLQGLGNMVRSMIEAGRLQPAIRYCRKILAVDPLRESTQRELLRLLGRAGQFDECARQYQQLSADLQRELDVEPSATTREVFRETMSMRGRSDGRPGAPATDGEILSTLNAMHGYLDEVEASRARLKEALARMTRLVDGR